MKRLIDDLPGVAMPVDAVMRTLRHMWDMEPGTENSPMDFRASQLNLILHFGLETTSEEVRGQFDTALRFAQKHPCRIVVLCPSHKTIGEYEFEGKLFSQCYIGPALRDLCCCEALIIGYSPEQSNFLENQVSVWLESDLPIYHWLHRVPPDRISGHYLGFLKRCQKVLLDGAVDGDNYDGIDWPDPRRVSDLSWARTLPLRQHLGQFISGFPPELLVDGLESLHIHYNRSMRRMAHHLMDWHRKALERCFSKPAEVDSVVFNHEVLPEDDQQFCLRIEWRFSDKNKSLFIDYDHSRKSGLIKTSFPGAEVEHRLHIEPLGDDAALVEAMFFG